MKYEVCDVFFVFIIIQLDICGYMFFIIMCLWYYSWKYWHVIVMLR
jgi:hypothetical protein